MVTFIETRLFTSLLSKYLGDDEYSDLQRALATNPEAGDVYLRTSENEIWMLTVYAKNEAASIPGHALKKIKEQIDGIV